MTDGNDWQWNQGFRRGRVIIPGTPHQLGTFGLFRPPAWQARVLNAAGADLAVRNAGGGLLWLGYDELCSDDLDMASIPALAREYRTWVIDDVPSAGAAGIRSSRRFGEIAAVLQDCDVTVFVICAATPEWGPENALSQLTVLESAEELPAEELLGS